jgi:hypothetical protein
LEAASSAIDAHLAKSKKEGFQERQRSLQAGNRLFQDLIVCTPLAAGEIVVAKAAIPAFPPPSPPSLLTHSIE